MSVLLVVVVAVSGLGVLVAKALAVDEARGRIQRRIAASLEATIAALPVEIQETWGEEWRAELAAVISMPWTAAMFVRNVRRDAELLVLSEQLALAPASDRSALRPKLQRTRSRIGRGPRRLLQSGARHGGKALQSFPFDIVLVVSVAIAGVTGVFVFLCHVSVGIGLIAAIFMVLMMGILVLGAE